MTGNHKTPRGKEAEYPLSHKSQDYFLDLSSKIKEIKAKINKWDLIKLKHFCMTKEAVEKMKTQPAEWEKIFSNDMTQQRLISNIYKQLIQLNTRKTNNTVLKNRAEDLNMHFSKEDMQMARQTAREKMVNITNHQGNATQNHNDIISHLSGWLATK